MKSTSVPTIVACGMLGATAGWLIDQLVVSRGGRSIVVPFEVAGVCIVFAIIVLAFAWPVRQHVREPREKDIDPLLAARTVALAKTVIVIAGFMAGFGIGLVLYLVARPEIATGYVMQNLIAAIAAGIALSAGIIAEQWCKLPPEDPKDAAPESS